MSKSISGFFNDSATTLTQGQEGEFRSTASRALHVNLRDASGNQVTPASFPADESTWTAGTTTFDPIGGAFNDSAAALTSGQQGTTRSTANRALHMNIRDHLGNEATLTGNSLNVNVTNGGSGGTSATDEAAATAGSTVFTPIGGVFNDSFANLTSGQMGLVRLTNTRSMHVTVDNTVTVSGTVTANQGTANSLANAWTVQITDTTNGPAAVKAASTAAVAADKALVVAVSPNNTVAVTQSTSPWVGNITQFGSTNISTGTGAGGAGIPRVTISNDSSLAANQSVNVNQIGGSNYTQGTNVIASSIPVNLADEEFLTQSLGTGGVVTLAGKGETGWGVAITGIGSMTLVFEYTQDGTNWNAAQAYPVGGGAAVTSTTANGNWVIPDQGYRFIRVRVSAFTSGTATVSVIGKYAAAEFPYGSQLSARSIPVVVASDQAAITVAQATAANLNATVVQATAANLNVQAVGNVANAASDSGNPIKIGGVGINAIPTAVTNGQRVNANYDLEGRALIAFADRSQIVDGGAITISTTTETTILAAGAAGIFNDLTLLMLTNTSSTAVRVDIRDATAGTVKFSVALAANGGAIIPFNLVPRNQTTAANNWTAQLSAAVTDIRILATAVTRKA